MIAYLEVEPPDIEDQELENVLIIHFLCQLGNLLGLRLVFSISI
jgi:hypothetical protein